MGILVASLSQTFAALGDDTRRAILNRLRQGEVPLSELAKHHAMTLTGVSNHVRVLNEAGLVNVEKRGRTRYCRIDPDAFRQAVDWFDDYRDFWGRQLENMADVLNEMDEDQ